MLGQSDGKIIIRFHRKLQPCRSSQDLRRSTTHASCRSGVICMPLKMLEMDRASLMVSATLSVGLGIAIGWILRGRALSGKLSKGMIKDLTDSMEAMAESGEIKVVLVVNNELKMGKGKIAAQCAHAAVGVAERAFQHHPTILRQWRLHGQPKVVVKADSTAMLKELGLKAQSLGLVSCLIADAGRTQIAPGSKTVLGVGPGPAALVDQVTGHLKLL